MLGPARGKLKLKIRGEEREYRTIRRRVSLAEIGAIVRLDAIFVSRWPEFGDLGLECEFPDLNKRARVANCEDRIRETRKNCCTAGNR